MNPKLYLVYLSKLTSAFAQIVDILHTRLGNNGNHMKMNLNLFQL